MAIDVNGAVNHYRNYTAPEVKSEGNAETKKTDSISSPKYQNTSEYQNYLSSNFYCMTAKKDGPAVSIEPGLLEKCIADPKAAEKLEYNLNLVPKLSSESRLQSAARGFETLSEQWLFKEDGSIETYTWTRCEADPGTDEQKDLLEKVKARIEEEKKLLKKFQEKRKKEVDDADVCLQKIREEESDDGTKLEVRRLYKNSSSVDYTI